MRFFGLLLILSFRLFAEPAYLTFPSDIDWKSMDSPHFEIIYRAGQNSFALRTLKAAERAHRLLTPRFPDSPPKTYIVLADFQDSLNGYSLDFPYPHMVIFASPPESWGELSSLDGWLTSVVLHEFVHTLHLFPANGAWKWLRSIFGTWVLPNGMLPSHLHEGLATFFETHFSQGGRGRSSIFSMYGRKSVETGKDDEVVFPLDGLDGSVSKWPHGTSPYYFGYFLYENLWKKKQDRGFYDLTLNTSKNWPYFVNSPFEETYGMDLPSLWEEIRNSQKDKHAKEISHLKTTPLSKLNYLTHTQFLKRELHLAPSNKELAFVSASPEKPIRIERIDSETGFPTKAHELALSGASGLCWNQTGETDYFVVSLSRSENFYSTHTVQVFNSDTNQTTPLQTASGQLEHVHQFDCSSDFNSIVTYQEQGGIGKLLVYQGNLLSADTSLQKTREWILPENSWVSSVLYGSEIYFLLREDTRSYLFRWDLSSTPVKLDTFKGHAHQLRRDKNRLFFISSSSGRDEVWEWHSRSKTKTKRVNLVGGVNSFAQQGETFWISSFETGGYDIAKVSGLQLVDDTLPQKEENSAPLLETVSASENSYSPWETLIPRTWVPSALFVNYGFQLGAWIPMFDLSQKHFYDLNLGIDHRELIDGTKTLPFASASYGYRFGRSFVAQASAYSIPGFLTIARSLVM
ncbi:MAG: hypothetical protein EBZ49_10350, partial [Proteobacteria bacterium]|nr:hypothetical protein [Pseudomonadota bacterium]